MRVLDQATGITHTFPDDATPEEINSAFESTKPPEDSAGMEFAKKTASIGTGVLRNVTALAMAPFDVQHMLKPASPGSAYDITSQDILPALNARIYQPRTPFEKVLAASAGGGVAALTGNPSLAIQGMIGSGLGEAASQTPYAKGLPPDAVRAAFEMGVPFTGAAAQHMPALVGAILHKLDPTWGHAFTMVSNVVRRARGLGAPPPAAVGAQELYGMGATGEKSQADLEALAKANRERLFGPDEQYLAAQPGADPGAASSAAMPGPMNAILQGLLRLTGTYGLSPEIQSKANLGQ